MADYSGYNDKHANARDRKREKRVTGNLMRGERSVFEIQKAQQNRDRRTVRKANKTDE
jgi:hypothetical protein